MITGDNAKIVQSFAKKVGVDLFFADVLPQKKAEIIKTMQKEVKFVAMGTGTDVAMNPAGVTLVKGDLMGIVRARS